MKYKFTPEEASKFKWDGVKGLNYKLLELLPRKSVLYAELVKDHGIVSTKDAERVYYILEGEGEFVIANDKISTKKGDVIVVPPKTKYDYKPVSKVLKVLLFMEYWDSTEWEK